MIRRPPRSTLFPTRRSSDLHIARLVPAERPARKAMTEEPERKPVQPSVDVPHPTGLFGLALGFFRHRLAGDRKSTRLNSSHTVISYAVFCLKQQRARNICAD